MTDFPIVEPGNSDEGAAMSQLPDAVAAAHDSAARSRPARDGCAPVLIVGGGTGGCAAALALADQGHRVVLTEPTDWIGGQLTAQMVPPDEHFWVEQFGVTRRYRTFRNSIRQYYRDHYPLLPQYRRDPHLNPGGGSVSRLCFEPRVGLAVLHQMMAPHLAAGRIQILHRHEPISAATQGDRVQAVAVRDLQTGEVSTITAHYVIDATELGDLLPLAGVEYVAGAESQDETGEPAARPGPPNPEDVQAWTWCVAISYDPNCPPNSDQYRIPEPATYRYWRDYVPQLDPPWSGRLFSWTPPDPATLQPTRRVLLASEVTPGGRPFWYWRYRQIIAANRYPPDAGIPDTTVINWPQNDFFQGNLLDRPGKERERLLAASRELTLSFLYWLQTEAPRPDGGCGYAGIYPRPDISGCEYGLAPAPYIRESRRIRGLFTVTENHFGTAARGGRPAEKFADSVGLAHYRIDLHPSAAGRNYVDLDALPVQIPLGALIPRRVRNLIAGAKNISVTHIANGTFRMHPFEWNIGEAAGLLAAYCLTHRVEPHQVHATPKRLADYQHFLIQNGVELDWPDPLWAMPSK